jgi:hypothetical protein
MHLSDGVNETRNRMREGGSGLQRCPRGVDLAWRVATTARLLD